MAINQRFHDAPGSSPVVILEQMTEPGQPRQFWDGKAWVASAAPIPLAPDPLIAGGFLLQIPSASTASWPDKVYLAHVVDGASPLRDEVIEHRFITVMAGDDGGNVLPSISVPLSSGPLGGAGTLKVFWATLTANRP